MLDHDNVNDNDNDNDYDMGNLDKAGEAIDGVCGDGDDGAGGKGFGSEAGGCGGHETAQPQYLGGGGHHQAGQTRVGYLGGDSLVVSLF